MSALAPTPTTLSVQPSRAIASVSAWMRRAVESGQPITEAQVRTWADAFDAAVGRAAELELLMIERQTDRLDRVDQAFADLLVYEGSRAVKVIASLAAEAATRSEMADIDKASVGVIAALEALARGVVRPDACKPGV